MKCLCYGFQRKVEKKPTQENKRKQTLKTIKTLIKNIEYNFEGGTLL